VHLFKSRMDNSVVIPCTVRLFNSAIWDKSNSISNNGCICCMCGKSSNIEIYNKVVCVVKSTGSTEMFFNKYICNYCDNQCMANGKVFEDRVKRCINFEIYQLSKMNINHTDKDQYKKLINIIRYNSNCN
jgi:hypothetical protein